MQYTEFIKCLEENPVIASTYDDLWDKAIASPAQVIFYLSANILSVEKRANAAHEAGKVLLVHADLAEGIGKDSSGIKYLQKCGVDGIISTKAHMIKLAKEYDMISIQRTFLFDTKGVEGISDVVKSTAPHFIEIMPGVIGKEIIRFSNGRTPVIAGGLIEEKAEVTRALCCGAIAVSTGKQELWFLQSIVTSKYSAEIQRVDRFTGTNCVPAICPLSYFTTSMNFNTIGVDAECAMLTFKFTKDIQDKCILLRLAWDLGILEELCDLFDT